MQLLSARRLRGPHGHAPAGIPTPRRRIDGKRSRIQYSTLPAAAHSHRSVGFRNARCHMELKYCLEGTYEVMQFIWRTS